MIVTIHQPEHLPWLGFFHKALTADCLVLLDTVPFRKNYFQNRNRIRGKEGPVWVTVPVLTKDKTGQPIREVRIDEEGNPRWRERCWKSLAQHSHGAPYWQLYEEALRDLYERRGLSLAELNEGLILQMLKWLSIPTKVLRASDLVTGGSSSSLLREICLKLGADAYLSGISGKNYLDLSLFAQAGIEVRFQEFHHPIYRQRYEPFIPCLSAMDLLFNLGPESREVLQGKGVPVMEELFL